MMDSLPGGPYLRSLAELPIDRNAFQPWRQPFPLSVSAAAAQLTSLAISLDASIDELEEQWPKVRVRSARRVVCGREPPRGWRKVSAQDLLPVGQLADSVSTR